MSRNVPLGYLRMFLTLMVVAYHAVLAYHPYSPPRPAALDGEMMFWAAFPVVDSAKWKGVDLFVGFNDTFFMSLLFLISGVFAWSSLAGKGAKRFVRDRFAKLGVAFLASAALLAPLAYIPAWLLTPRTSSFAAQWLALGSWPSGPAWFLWVLLLFVCALAVLPRFTARFGRLGERPFVFFLALIGISALAYLPMAALFSPVEWVKAGPFFLQISRLVHYGAYFLIGAALGAYGVDRGLFAGDGKLARRWPLWVLGSFLAFAFAIAMFLVIISTGAKGPGPILSAIGNFAFVLSCAASSLAFIAVFVRFANKANRVADSLSANAFGIYLLHYACVSWLQLAMLRAPLSGMAKGTIVTVAAILISWALTALARQIRWRSAPAPGTIPGVVRVHLDS